MEGENTVGQALTFAKPKARRSGGIQIPRGGISFGLR